MAPANSSRNFSAPEARNGSGERGLRGPEGTSPAGRPCWGWRDIMGCSRGHMALELSRSPQFSSICLRLGQPATHEVREAEHGDLSRPAPPPRAADRTRHLQHPRADSAGPRAVWGAPTPPGAAEGPGPGAPLRGHSTRIKPGRRRWHQGDLKRFAASRL